MSGLKGFDGTGFVWLSCNSDGELLIDPTAILEDTPTDGELSKAPTSNWAYDHDADANAHHTPPVAGDFNHNDLANIAVDDHHAKYTDVESRAAINNIFGSDGKADTDIDFDHNDLEKVVRIYFDDYYNTAGQAMILYKERDDCVQIWAKNAASAYENFALQVYDGTGWQDVIRDDTFQTALALYLEETPTDAVVNKAPTSNWAYDHENDIDAHHVKYTDLEAQTACNLNGTHYLAIPGTLFTVGTPATDAHYFVSTGTMGISQDDRDVRCPVILPDGATVTSCIVNGNAGATSQTWYLRQVLMSDRTMQTMATAAVATQDNSISYAVIDNSIYYYVLTCEDLDTNDVIYYARIGYTL